jgi:tellurite methyltransferase
MENDRARWNERYAGEEYLLGVNPSPFLVEVIDRLLTLAPGKAALDIACGEGRNSVFLARHGFSVTGVDISENGLAKAERFATESGTTVRFLRADLETWEIPDVFDLIVNFNYLQCDLIPKMAAALSPGGLIVFDTLLDAPGAPPTRTRSHLLQPGELVRLFAPLPGRIIHAEERPIDAIPTARIIFARA